ncbi:MAG: 50S ribosomal protein L4 [Gammaproteobacteria bacterium RIFCSPHIGHO2_12_FULL_37_14]|nr:MAG: 50S ribosomal protein L4 [Gammaproteobacteria bacterium RIFCSPHIGHO2_12_FULL_37_14]
MELKFADSQKKFTLADEVFACEFNEALIHQIVSASMSGRRAGTKAQKTRAEVRGGGAKPWKQKGTGRARAGTIRSPLWRTGGRTFAAKPRCYKQKVNRKMHKGAMRSIFSELIRQERLLVVNTFQIDEPRTKALLKKLNEMNIVDRVLIVSDVVDNNLYLAARNIPNVEVSDAAMTAADPVALIKAEKVLITEAALKEIEGLLQ